LDAALFSAGHPGFDDYAPENDLRPDPARLAFDLRVLQDKFKRLVQAITCVVNIS